MSTMCAESNLLPQPRNSINMLEDKTPIGSILIVEDDQKDQKRLVKALEKIAKCTTAKNGSEALDKFIKKYNFIIS